MAENTKYLAAEAATSSNEKHRRQHNIHTGNFRATSDFRLAEANEESSFFVLNDFRYLIV